MNLSIWKRPPRAANGEGSSSLLIRLATSSALLAVAVVLLATIFFHAIRGDIFEGAFKSPLKEWSALVAGRIGEDPAIAQAAAKNHRVGVVVTTPDSRFAFGPDGAPANADELSEDNSRFRRIDIWVQHEREVHYLFLLDREQFDDERSPLLIGLIVLLLITIGLAYLTQLNLLRPLKWLRSGVDAVSEGNFSTRVPVVRNDEIGKVARAFNQMTGRVQRMVDDRERLLADVSHELRSPLARIRVALALLPEGTKRDSIAKDVKDMELLIAALLEREQVRSGAARTISERFNLAALTAEVIDGFGTTLPGVELSVPPQELEIEGDHALIKILIQNLVENAIKFSLADSKPVEITLQQTENEIQIAISDNGRGIPEAQAERVFEPFVKLDPARGHRAGYGLGLNLCQRIVRAHAGSIEIENRSARGTIVTVKLPKKRPESR